MFILMSTLCLWCYCFLFVMLKYFPWVHECFLGKCIMFSGKLVHSCDFKKWVSFYNVHLLYTFCIWDFWDFGKSWSWALSHRAQCNGLISIECTLVESKEPRALVVSFLGMPLFPLCTTTFWHSQHSFVGVSDDIAF